MNFKRDKYESVVMCVTPALAAQMLETSPGNRMIREAYVNKLVGAMRRGEWMVTNQGVGFNRLGQLRDGHHRLNACVRSGIPMETLVVMGMDADVYSVVDTGLKRQMNDLTGLPRKVTDVLNLACSYIAKGNSMTVKQMLPYLDGGLMDEANFIHGTCPTASKYFSSAPMRLAACISLMEGGDRAYIAQQYKALCLLDIDSMSTSARALYKQVSTGSVRALNRGDTIARGLVLFDVSRQHQSMYRVTDLFIEKAIQRVVNTLSASVGMGV